MVSVFSFHAHKTNDYISLIDLDVIASSASYIIVKLYCLWCELTQGLELSTCANHLGIGLMSQFLFWVVYVGISSELVPMTEVVLVDYMCLDPEGEKGRSGLKTFKKSYSKEFTGTYQENAS